MCFPEAESKQPAFYLDYGYLLASFNTRNFVGLAVSDALLSSNHIPCVM